MSVDTPTIPEGSDRRLHPKIRYVWLIGSVVSDLVFIALITLGIAMLDVNTNLEVPRAIYVAPFVLAVVLIPVRTWHAFASYRFWCYRFTADGLELEHGVFWKKTSAMPYHRLQQVDVGQGPLERALGMSTVQLRSAAATTDASIPGIAEHEVEELRRTLMQRAGHDGGT